MRATAIRRSRLPRKRAYDRALTFLGTNRTGELITFRAQLAGASAALDIANEGPHDGDCDHEYENSKGNQDTRGILHRKFAVYGVEAIKGVDGRGQGEHIIFRLCRMCSCG